MGKLRDHQIATESSFKKVKQKHKCTDAKLGDQEKRIKQLERTLKSLRALEPMKVTRRRKKRS